MSTKRQDASRFKITSAFFDPQTASLVEATFSGDNLVQAILHVHLLVERGLCFQIARKFIRPEAITGKDARWTFSALVRLYVGLYDPKVEYEQQLRGINKLRNTVAHELHIAQNITAECLPWYGEQFAQPPDALTHLRVVAITLLFHLEVLDSLGRADEQTHEQLAR